MLEILTDRCSKLFNTVSIPFGYADDSLTHTGISREISDGMQ